MSIDAAWADWYYASYQTRYRRTGTAFEEFTTDVLQRFHTDFWNPDPTGSLGDGGSDGLANAGSTLYAAYGSASSTERSLAQKIEGDWTRGLSEWGDLSEAFFVTNRLLGKLATAVLIKFQQQYSPSSGRHVAFNFFNEELFWKKRVKNLATDDLNELFPGRPGSAHIALSDLAPLLDELGKNSLSPSGATGIAEVPVTKMDYNSISDRARMEFQAGRHYAPQIQYWYDNQAEPRLRSIHADRFAEIYKENMKIHTDSDSILERMYVSLAGPNFRLDPIRANAAYAVTAFFFDACDIFEKPPSEWASSDVPFSFEGVS